MITKLSIKNFKGIKDLTLDNLKQINQVIGSNGVGKTSVHEAIQFLFEGTGRDKLKIKDGEVNARVHACLDVDDQKVEIIATITNEGKSEQKFCVNGKWHKESKRSIVRSLFGVASFDPSAMLDPKNRVKVFQELVKGDFEVPEVLNKFRDDWLVQDFPSKDTLPKNPIEALNSLKAFLEMYRKLVYKNKHSAKEVLGYADDNYKKAEAELLQCEFNIDDLEEGKLLKLKAKSDLAKDKIEENKSNLSKHSEDFSIMLESIEKERKDVEELNGMIVRKNEKIFQAVTLNKSLGEKIEKLQQDITDAKEEPSSFTEKLRICKIKGESKTLKKIVDEKQDEFKLKEKEYREVNHLLQQKFDELYSVYLKDIQKKIPEISFTSKGWAYNNVSLDMLSRSETLTIGLKLIEAQNKKSNVICFDNAEAFHNETVLGLPLNKKGTTVFLLKVGEAFKGLDSSVFKLEKEAPLKI